MRISIYYYTLKYLIYYYITIIFTIIFAQLFSVALVPLYLCQVLSLDLKWGAGENKNYDNCSNIL